MPAPSGSRDGTSRRGCGSWRRDRLPAGCRHGGARLPDGGAEEAQTATVRISRRNLLRGGAVVAAVAAAGITEQRLFGGSDADVAAASTSAAPTTADRTLVRGTPINAGGYVRVVEAPGEPHVVRTDIGGVPAADRASRRRPLLSFGHLTDLHVVDAQSPARVEFLDRYNDTAPSGPFAAAYRPHEMLSTQVANAMVATVAAVQKGPVLAAPLSFSISTGDAVDNCQFNELRWMIDLLDGGANLRPDSGSPERYEGVADDDRRWYDPSYWHPAGPPPGRSDDIAHARYGFPRVPGLLDAARRPFRTTGL